MKLTLSEFRSRSEWLEQPDVDMKTLLLLYEAYTQAFLQHYPSTNILVYTSSMFRSKSEWLEQPDVDMKTLLLLYEAYTQAFLQHYPS